VGCLGCFKTEAQPLTRTKLTCSPAIAATVGTTIARVWPTLIAAIDNGECCQLLGVQCNDTPLALAGGATMCNSNTFLTTPPAPE
jgi:hypothetical protein